MPDLGALVSEMPDVEMPNLPLLDSFKGQCDSLGGYVEEPSSGVLSGVRVCLYRNQQGHSCLLSEETGVELCRQEVRFTP